jgi:23S rRNA pseudouridine2605 synthase
MRINAFVARASGLSRRAADKAINNSQVLVDGQPAQIGAQVTGKDTVTLDGKPLILPDQTTTIILNKPVGYVCSRDGQGSSTIYDLLPPEYHQLKPVGRLDKDSSGLLLLTNDGGLANQLTHPSYAKTKVYEVTLNKPLQTEDKNRVEQGVKLSDGISKLQIKNLDGPSFTVTMAEGRNRQIRRTFDTLGYKVTGLHRTHFGDYGLGNLPLGQLKTV